MMNKIKQYIYRHLNFSYIPRFRLSSVPATIFVFVCLICIGVYITGFLPLDVVEKLWFLSLSSSGSMIYATFLATTLEDQILGLSAFNFGCFFIFVVLGKVEVAIVFLFFFVCFFFVSKEKEKRPPLVVLFFEYSFLYFLFILVGSNPKNAGPRLYIAAFGPFFGFVPTVESSTKKKSLLLSIYHLLTKCDPVRYSSYRRRQFTF